MKAEKKGLRKQSGGGKGGDGGREREKLMLRTEMRGTTTC